MQPTEHQTPRTSLPLQALIDTRYNIVNRHGSNDQGRSDFPGQRMGTRRGQGLEYIDLRQYASGDDTRHIDWNVTARYNEPYTRLYREEREQTTVVAVDLRPSMFSGSHCLLAVSAGLLAATVLWQASEYGDRCGAVVISERGQRSTRPLAGKKGVLQACELISSEFAQVVQTQRDSVPPLSRLLDSFSNKARQTGRFFVFSGFDTASDEQWLDQLSIAGATRRMIAILLLDPVEARGLPTGKYNYRHRLQSSTATITNANQHVLADILRNSIHQQKQQFRDAGVSPVTHNTDNPASDLLAELQQRRLV